MANVKDLNRRIASLKSTQKMTRTMKLVSASKMRRAQQAQSNARDYALELRELMLSVTAASRNASHPLLLKPERTQSVLILLLTSDRGLCGGFNNNLNRHVLRWIADNRASYPDVSMSFCGKRGYTFFKNRAKVVQNYTESTQKPNYEIAARIAVDLMNAFVAGTYQAVYVAHNRFKSALSQTPVMDQLLPIEQGAEDEKEKAEQDCIFEPGQAQLLQLLLPFAVKFAVFNAFLENAAGEHAARMTSMDNATRNAEDMIDRFTLLRNRVRQAAITKELIEIVTGAESL